MRTSIILLVLLAGILFSCEDDSPVALPELAVSAEKVVLCPGESVSIALLSQNPSLDLSRVELRVSPDLGAISHAGYQAPAEVSGNQTVRIQAYYDSELIPNAFEEIFLDGSTVNTFVKTHQVFDPRSFNQLSAELLDGNSLVVSVGEGRGDRQFRVIQMDFEGAIAWTRDFGPGSCEVIRVADGRIYAGGVSYEGGQTTAVVIELDAAGNLLSRQELGAVYSVTDMQITPEGEVFLAAALAENAQQSVIIHTGNEADFPSEKVYSDRLIKRILWSENEGLFMTMLKQNESFIGGYDAEGNEIWAKELGAGQNFLPLAKGENGDLVVGIHALKEGQRAFGIQRFNTNGERLFTGDYGVTNQSWEDFLYDLDTIGDGIILSGMRIQDGTSRQYLIKLDEQGSKEWEWTYGNEQAGGFSGNSVVTDQGVFVWGVLGEASSSSSIIRLTSDGSLRPCQQEGF